MEIIKEIRIPEQKILNGRVFPLILSPLKEKNPSGFEELLKYTKSNNYSILQQTLTYGAILFRGWKDITPNDFAIFTEALGLKK